MTDEQAFLSRILSDLKDDAARLVYADWLDERGDEVSTAKAEFLRISNNWAKLPPKKRKKNPLTYRLMELAVTLDKDWLAVNSKIPIENCEPFDFQCPKQWENLNATEDTGVRFCEECRKNVYYCNDIEEARNHAVAGDCVAVDLGVIRRANDLEMPIPMMLGRISPDYFRRRIEEERADAEREYGRPSQASRKPGRG
jgi:uncharacterized protein (TIGR02996 family)